MTYEENVRAILESNLTDIKDEIKDNITDKIVSLKCQDIIYNGVSDLDSVKDWNICGYRVEDLVKLSLILRDRRIEDVDLRDYNDCFFDGYRKAYDEIHNRIKKMTDDLIEANNKFKGVEDN